MSSTPLARATPDLAGTGGTLKAEPEHFVVEELPLYEPSGAGEHVYLCLRRAGWTTHELARRLALLFDLQDRAIGVAGRKDKAALVTQTFSLHLPGAAGGAAEEVAARVRAELPVEVLDARRHANKLKRGHLRGNRFTVRVTDLADPALALERAHAVRAALEARGLPNYFGPQRFGADGRNVERGRALLERLARGVGRRPRSDRDRLMLSAWQSELFNRWLDARIRRGAFAELEAGDVAEKTDTGGLFVIEDVALERPRFLRGEIAYTGPLFGARMRRPEARAAQLEDALFPSPGEPFDERVLALAGLDGSRRAGRIAPRALAVRRVELDLIVAFELPKGSYATTLLAEITKREAFAQPDVDAASAE